MTKILVTGSEGFVGKNLREALQRQDCVEIIAFDVHDDASSLDTKVLEADIIYHLAGVNRPKEQAEFITGNTELTQRIAEILTVQGKTTPVVMSSSTQAALDNPYGVSKREAENSLFAYARKNGAPVYVYRLTNVFGKWSRPNYNSVVSTFCYNSSHGLDIIISNPANIIELVYIDDVVKEFVSILHGKATPSADACLSVVPTYTSTLGELAERIYQLRDVRTSLLLPDLSDNFTRCLYATYLSYLDTKDFSYQLDIKMDNRGRLAELIKSEHFGQIFVSRSHARIIRGNHYHNTKIEKFCVLQGQAVIRFRHIFSNEVISYPISGEDFTVVDIPPGYTHSIENLSDEEMVVLFWANQIFDPEKSDTFYCEVECEKN
jgi:UDP-2-acetamido-2,6-beta-L-arabino-hexul-4-ose reductase